MAQIRHIAFASKDPGHAAEFYKKAFGLHELGRFGPKAENGQEAPPPSAVMLTDGNINIAILRVTTNQVGYGLSKEGFNHFGVVVDDIAAWTEALKGMGAEQLTTAENLPRNAHFEIKFQGPDGVVFDISPSPWPGASSVPENGMQFGAREVPSA